MLLFCIIPQGMGLLWAAVFPHWLFPPYPSNDDYHSNSGKDKWQNRTSKKMYQMCYVYQILYDILHSVQRSEKPLHMPKKLPT
jgi:hypothetical protein